MVNVKKTIKTDLVLKEARIVGGKLLDAYDEIVDLYDAIEKIYGENTFKLTLSQSTSEEVGIDELED